MTRCEADCSTCPQATNCVNLRRPETLFTPLHWGVWAALGALVAASSWALAFPRRVAKVVAGEAYYPPEEHEAFYRGVAERVGVRSNNVLFLETRSFGPTCVGSDSWRGAVIFVPHAMAMAALSEEHSEEERAELLQDGVLLPTRDEFTFVVGHELAHVMKNHAGHTAVVSLLAAVSASALIKAWNTLHWEHRPRLTVRGRAPFLGLVFLGLAATSFTQSWLQEFEADSESATRLNLVEESIALKKKQILQGHQPATMEHPPVHLQLRNLERLRK